MEALQLEQDIQDRWERHRWAEFAEEDGLDDEERTRLHAFLEESLASETVEAVPL